ncbi:MAG TPA: uroporphyrinogen-III C-methyltransferase [Gammaproteobacteria bacterium]|nr:uroporphyrinogen-III C-methyltransferase [Gammaproteobacteria bacterium]
MTTQDQSPTEAAAPPETTSSEQAPAADAASSKAAGGRGSPLVSLLALALALFATATAGFLWWQYREFYVALDRADGDMDVSLRGVRADLRALEDRLGGLSERDSDITRVVDQIVERLNASAARFSDLEQRQAALQGVSADARGRWLRAQAEYFLGIANAELALRANRNNAIAALELADQALLDAGSPAYSAVRERIAGELVALRGARAPDLEGLSYSLSRLAARVTELPMRAPAPEDETFAPPANDAEPGLGRLWQSFKNALAGMVRIERNDTTAVYSLSRNQQMLVRRQLELELTLARLALVQAMPELFTTSIGNARALLEQHFETDTSAVEGALALLGEMRALEVAPRYPDISGSLALLRDLPDREN